MADGEVCPVSTLGPNGGSLLLASISEPLPFGPVGGGREPLGAKAGALLVGGLVAEGPVDSFPLL